MTVARGARLPAIALSERRAALIEHIESGSFVVPPSGGISGQPTARGMVAAKAALTTGLHVKEVETRRYPTGRPPVFRRGRRGDGRGGLTAGLETGSPTGEVTTLPLQLQVPYPR